MSLGGGRLKRDFAAYSQLEAMNVMLVPGLAIWFGWPRTLVEALALISSIVATAGLLVVGTIYWRAVDRRLKARAPAGFADAMLFADQAERPMMLATIVATIMAVVAFTLVGLSRSVIVAGVMTLLAVLEYVNYYHRQLQVIDNAPDFRRLVVTGRLKKAHMARDLAAYRRRDFEAPSV